MFGTVQNHRIMTRLAMQSGALEYVVKCDAGEELVAAVWVAIRGDRYLSANARRALEGAGEPPVQNVEAE